MKVIMTTSTENGVSVAGSVPKPNNKVKLRSHERRVSYCWWDASARATGGRRQVKEREWGEKGEGYAVYTLVTISELIWLHLYTHRHNFAS
jgi:hypothetical protein